MKGLAQGHPAREFQISGLKFERGWPSQALGCVVTV